MQISFCIGGFLLLILGKNISIKRRSPHQTSPFVILIINFELSYREDEIRLSVICVVEVCALVTLPVKM